MGFLDSIGEFLGFGSDKPKTMSTLDPEQEALKQALVKLQLGTLDEETGKWSGGLLSKGVAPYEGKLTTNTPYLAGVLVALNDLLSGRPSYDLSPELTNRRFKESVVNPALRAYNEYIAPQIRDSFSRVGGISSRQGAAQAQVLGNMQSDFSRELADMLYKNQALQAGLAESAIGRQAAAAQLAMALQGQQYQQAAANKAMTYQEWLRRQPQNNPMLNVALTMLGQPYLATYKGTSGLEKTLGAVKGLSSLVSNTVSFGSENMDRLTKLAGLFR